MKHFQAILALLVLTASKRHRQRWGQSADRVDTVLDNIEASNRRIAALKNGGRPKVRVV